MISSISYYGDSYQENRVYNSLMGAAPLLVDAGIFGWVSRRRLFWGVSPSGLSIEELGAHMPPGTKLVSEEGLATVAYEGTLAPPVSAAWTGIAFRASAQRKQGSKQARGPSSN